MKAPLITTVAALLTFCWASLADEAGIGADQLTSAVIVVADDAPPSTRYAAEELQLHVEKATGVKLSIANAPQSAMPVFVGDSAPLSQSDLSIDTSAFGQEDFRIRVAAQGIAIAGGEPRGALYGVYTFLEDALDVRFLTPDHTHVPAMDKSGSIAFVDRTYHPPLAYRHAGYDQTTPDLAFAARVRSNTFTTEPKFGGVSDIQLINHTLVGFIPAEKYGQSHPEYFAMIDGKRKTDFNPSYPGETVAQPCLTNPEVLRIVTEGVLDQLRQNPRLRMVVVAQNDNQDYCRCDNCSAIDAREGTAMGALLTFVNAVADAVAREHPDVEVGTLAYQYSRKPPKSLKPHPNVRIQLCSIEACNLHSIDDPNCPRNTPFCADLDAWQKICGKISVWAYNGNFSDYLLPFPNFKSIGPTIRYFADHRVDGLLMQIEHGGNAPGPAGEFSDLRHYMTAMLLWDPTKNDQQLQDEFLTLHYGPAAEPIRAFIDLVRENCESKELHPTCFSSPADIGIDESVADAGLKAFADATHLAGDDPVLRERVEKASIAAYRAAIEPVWRADDLSAVAAPVAEKMKPLVREFLRLCEKHGVDYVTAGETLASKRAHFAAWK